MIRLDFTEAAYVRTALWSSTDEHAEPLDSTYDAESIYDLPGFLESLHDFLAEPDVAEILARHGISRQQAAGDFWLTRNHHGAGFLDRGLGKDGQTLTDAADAYGECTLMPGDQEPLTLFWS
jgi:hypothetical protein